MNAGVFELAVEPHVTFIYYGLLIQAFPYFGFSLLHVPFGVVSVIRDVKFGRTSASQYVVDFFVLDLLIFVYIILVMQKGF